MAKLLCLSEFQEDFDSLDRLLGAIAEREDLSFDVAVLNGSISEGPWSLYDSTQNPMQAAQKNVQIAQNFARMQQDLDAYRRHTRQENLRLDEIARQIAGGDVRLGRIDVMPKIAESYLDYLKKSYGRMGQVYQELLHRLEGISFFVLHGNRDNPFFTIQDLEDGSMRGIFGPDCGAKSGAPFLQTLEEGKMKLTSKQTPCGTIAGYGGAYACARPPAMPEEFSPIIQEHFVQMPEGNVEVFWSEPYDLLRRTRPDVLVTYMPPRGVLDVNTLDSARFTGTQDPRCGSFGLANFLDESGQKGYAPKLWLVAYGALGHEENVGAHLEGSGNTVVVNPGVFSYRAVQGGMSSFAIVEMEELEKGNQRFKNAKFYNLDPTTGEIHPGREFYRFENSLVQRMRGFSSP